MVQPVALWVVIPEDLLPLDPLELVEVVGAEGEDLPEGLLPARRCGEGSR